MDGQSLMKSTWLKVFSVLLLVLIIGPQILPAVKAAPVDEFMEPFKIALSTIVDLFKLDFLPADVDTYAAVVRFCLWLVTFTIIYEILTKFNYFSSKSSKIIALAFSIISAVFMPQKLLIIIGESYAALFSMIFIGAIVFVGMKLGNWVEKQGGPASKWMFIMIMLVLMWLVWLIQWELADERNVPEMEWWIFGTIYNWFGTIAFIALGWTLVTKGFLGGGGGTGGGGGGLFGGGGGDTGTTRKTEKETAEALQEGGKASQEVNEIEQMEVTLKQLNEIEGSLQTMRNQLDTNALEVLGQLVKILPQLEAAARDVQSGAGNEQYAGVLNNCIALIHEIATILSKEKKLEEQAEHNLRNQIRLARKEENKYRKGVTGTIVQAMGRLEKAYEAKGKELTGAFKAAQGNEALYKNYKEELKKWLRKAQKLSKQLKWLEKNELRLVQRMHKELGKEVDELSKYEKLLQHMRDSPDPKQIEKVTHDLGPVIKHISERVHSYGLGTGTILDGGTRIKGSSATAEGIHLQLAAINQRLKQIEEHAKTGEPFKKDS